MNSYLSTATAMRSAHASFIGRIGRHFSKFSYSLLLIALLFGSGGVWGQTAGDYRSRQSGDWNGAMTWQVYSGGNWINTVIPPTYLDGAITIRNTHSVTVTANVSVDQTRIAPGGTLTINAVVVLTVLNGAGADLAIPGTCVVNGTLMMDDVGTITSAGSLTFNNGGKYVHNRDSSAIPAATWNPGSTCEVTGVTNTTVSGLNQTFANFVWNCSGQGADLNLSTAAGTMSVAGNLEIINTGATWRLSLNQDDTLNVAGNFIQSGGTFRLVRNAIPRVLIVGGDFQLSGSGVFIGSSGGGAATLHIAGNYSQTGGTFDQREANNTSTSTVTIEGDFSLSSGTYDISGVNNAVGNLNVAGDFSHTVGTLTESGGGTSNGVITLNGSALQTFTTTGWATTNRINFVMNNSGAGVQLLSPLTINANSSLTFTDGIVDGNGHLVIFRNNSTTSGASNASFVDGVVRKIGNAAFTFPVGAGTTYRPIGITAPVPGAATDSFQAEYFEGDPVSATAAFMPVSTVLEVISDKEYWDLDRSNGTSTTTVVMFFKGSSMANMDDVNSLRVARFDEMSMEWVSQGNTMTSGAPDDEGTVASDMVTNFSIFTLGSSVPLNALPIELLVFTATPKGKTVQLDWRTATELNNAFFHLERSADGRDFSEIGKVAGAGTSHTPLDYAFTDQLPKTGWNYYRLRQVDFDGQFSYSPVQAVQMGKDGTVRLQLFPNPANNALNLKTDRLIEPADRLEIYDYTGRQVMSCSASDAVSAPMDISQLPAGTYVVRLRMAEGTTNAAFVKQ